MSNINEISTMPLLQHRFHCFVEGNFSEEEVKTWSQHIQSCDFDFKNNIVTVVLYQSVDPTLYRVVEKAAQENVDELVVSLSPVSGESDCIVVYGIICISHSMMFDYSGVEKVVHVIQFSYQKLGHEVRELTAVNEANEEMKKRIMNLSEAAAKAVSPKEALKKMKKKK